MVNHWYSRFKTEAGWYTTTSFIVRSPSHRGRWVRDRGSKDPAQNWKLVGYAGGLKADETPSLDLWMGEALPPSPYQLWEYINMAELWPYVETELGGQPGQSTQKKHPVTNILLWLQCFEIYVGVLACQYPEVVPELTSSMVIINKATQHFSDQSCIHSDTMYRRQAAARKCRKWSIVNGSLFSICFTGFERKESSVTGVGPQPTLLWTVLDSVRVRMFLPGYCSSLRP